MHKFEREWSVAGIELGWWGTGEASGDWPAGSAPDWDIGAHQGLGWWGKERRLIRAGSDWLAAAVRVIVTGCSGHSGRSTVPVAGLLYILIRVLKGLTS